MAPSARRMSAPLQRGIALMAAGLASAAGDPLAQQLPEGWGQAPPSGGAPAGGALPAREASWTVVSGTPVCTNWGNWTGAWDGNRSDWIVKLPDGWSTARCRDYGAGPLPGGSSVEWWGHPSEGGVPATLFRGTQWELRQFLDDHTGAVFVEEDAAMGLATGLGRSLAAQSLNPAIWGLDRIDAEEGLDQTFDSGGFTGRGVHVYVADTGIRTTHQDFEGRAVPTLEALGGRVVECNGNPGCAVDRDGHGTHCAGTVGGRLFGVAKEATLHAVKVLGDDGSGSFASFVQALDFVASRGLRPAVLSASLGGRGRLRSVNSAIRRAVDAGVTVVVAAGNEGETSEPDACAYTPAGVPEAITVGSVGRPRFNDLRSGFSNIGPCVDIFAPGGLIPSCGVRSDGDTAFLSGTSMACPHVSGAAALLLQQDPRRLPRDVDRLLKARATVGRITDAGAGSPNRLLFVGALEPAPTPAPPAPAPAAPTPAPGAATPAPAPPTPAPVQPFREISSGTCAEAGLKAVTLASTCELAAQALGKQDTTASDVGSDGVPEGCFVEDGARLLMGTSATARGVPASQRLRPLCTSLVPSFQEVTSGNCAGAGLSPTTLVTACDDARRALGVQGAVQLTSARGAPEGCFVFRGVQVFLSVNPANRGNGAAVTSQGSPLTPVCMAFVAPGQPPAPAPTPAPPATAAPTPAPAAPAFRALSSGACAGQGLFPIVLAPVCEAAAEALGLPDTSATGTGTQRGPEGCFLFRGRRLFLGTAPAARGRGASAGRQPLCTSLRPRRQLLESGTCAEAGLFPVNGLGACDDARRALGLARAARVTGLVGVPEGCFLFRGAFVFLGANPRNAGNGADTSKPGNPLRPLCMAYDAGSGGAALAAPAQASGPEAPCDHALCSEIEAEAGSPGTDEAASGCPGRRSAAGILSALLVSLRLRPGGA